MKRESTLRITSDFTDVLSFKINELGLTYIQAANRVNGYLSENFSVSNVSLSAYANGKSRPRRIEVVRAIAAAFDIDLELLIETPDDFSKVKSKKGNLEDNIIELHQLSGNRVRVKLDVTTSRHAADKVYELLRNQLCERN